MEALEKQAGMILLGGGILSVAIFLFAQCRIVSCDQKILKGQLLQVSKRITDAKEALSQVDATINKSERDVARAKELEAIYASFLTELLETANTSPEARTIAQKWKIQHSGAPADPPPVAPTPPPEKNKTPARR
jgi:hypothetical protein